MCCVVATLPRMGIATDGPGTLCPVVIRESGPGWPCVDFPRAPKWKGGPTAYGCDKPKVRPTIRWRDCSKIVWYDCAGFAPKKVVYESGPWITGRATIPTGEYPIGARVIYKDHEGDTYPGTVVERQPGYGGPECYLVWLDDFDALRANRQGIWPDDFKGPLSLTHSMLDIATPW